MSNGKQVSPFPTIPPVQADMGTLITCMQALRQCMNILIVNAQQNPQTPNLQGTQIFAKYPDLVDLQRRVTALEKIVG